MKLRKKIVLSCGIVVIMLIALVLGIALPNKNNNNTIPQDANNNIKQEKPLTYTYEAGDITIKNGEKTINYQYMPSTDSSRATTTAYEYVVGNTMSTLAAVDVYLDNLDTTDVNIAYAYSLGTPLDTSVEITAETYYTIQTIAVGNADMYIYVLITPADVNNSTSFTGNVEVKYGKARTLTISNNLNDDITTKTVVEGKTMEEPSIAEAEKGYYFDAWYLDKEFTKLASFPMESPTNLYARYANLPTDYLEYDIESDSYYVKQRVNNEIYNGSLAEHPISDLIIPAVYNNAYVTYIQSASEATNSKNVKSIFKDCNSIKLPFTIKTIGDYAFSRCYLLTEIDLPKAITSIGNYVFYNCNSLSNAISVPSGVVSIGNYAFAGCSVSSIILPNTITTIGNSAFENSKLTSVSLNTCTNLTSIGNNAFYGCTDLSAITLPNNLTSIKDNTFYNCNSLKSIVIPKGVTDIKDNAFYGCSALETVNLNTCINMVSIGASAFRYCSSMTSITIPKNVAAIGSDAFANCSNLSYVILPSGLTTISNAVFMNCISLQTVYLNNCAKLTQIGNYAFANTGLMNIDLTYCTSLISIGDYAFYRCDQLNSVKLPSSLTKVGSGAFYTQTDSSIFKTLKFTYDINSIWCVTNSKDYSGGQVIDLSNSSNNVKYFVNNTCSYYEGFYLIKITVS